MRPPGSLPATFEIAQHHVTQFRGRRGKVAQHPLAHQLRRAIRIDRHGRRVFPGETRIGNSVDRGRRREHEAAHARGVAIPRAGCESRRCCCGSTLSGSETDSGTIVCAAKCSNSVDGMVLQDSRHENAIAGVTDDQAARRARRCGTPSRGCRGPRHAHALDELATV